MSKSCKWGGCPNCVRLQINQSCSCSTKQKHAFDAHCTSPLSVVSRAQRRYQPVGQYRCRAGSWLWRASRAQAVTDAPR